MTSRGGKPSLKVGYIGLGKMGSGMSLNLLKAGFSVTVRDVVPDAEARIVKAGAKKAATAADVVRASDVTFTSLPTIEAVDEVYTGKDGVASAAAGKIVADMSTVDLACSRRIAEAVAAKGGAFLDSPVSGGPERAGDGTLTIFVGGDKAAFEKALPALKAMGKNVQHVGGTGAGTVFKLVNQLMVGINVLGVAEAIAISNKAGVDPKLIIEMISTAWGGSTMLTRSGPLMVARDWTPKGTNVLLYKDLGCVKKLADTLGIKAIMGEKALELFTEIMHDNMGEMDNASTLLLVEKHSKK